MSIQSEITRISNEVATQQVLISTIKTALQGKASGGELTTEVWTLTMEDGSEVEKEMVIV